MYKEMAGKEIYIYDTITCMSTSPSRRITDGQQNSEMDG